MSSSRYLTSPPDTTEMPKGIPYIVGNEAAERFSFYGMKAILTVFMTEYLLNSQGELATLSDEDAKFWVHTFVVGAYFFPILGAIVADWLWGKYATILWLSVVYCLGHLALALDSTWVGLAIGLVLISIGTGAIKPCVSAHVGDQFGSKNTFLLPRVFGWFYLAINLGAFCSTLLTPILLNEKTFYATFGEGLRSVSWIQPGPHLAFGVPGVLMAIATVVFWMGRHVFVHVPPRGKEFLKDSFTGEGLSAIKRLIPIYIFVAAFWCLFDQTASAWVLQAKQMDLNMLGRQWQPSQLQAANPMFILILVPTFTYVVYPLVDRIFPLTPLRKVSIGMFLTVAAFSVSGLIETWIQAGHKPERRLADLGVFHPHLRRDHGLDYLPGVLVHPGPQQHEVGHHVAVPAVGGGRQRVHRDRQLGHQEPGRQHQAAGSQLLLVLYGGDGGGRDRIRVRGDAVSRPQLRAGPAGRRVGRIDRSRSDRRRNDALMTPCHRFIPARSASAWTGRTNHGVAMKVRR